MNLYVYYRIQPAMHADGRQMVAQLLQQMAPYCERMQLAHRVDDPDTWMEVYENIGDRAEFSRIMASCLQTMNLESCLVTIPGKAARMEEWFQLMPCETPSVTD
ncbi:DUF4936 family protein [Leeia oryzae]|uniref:DUF4936 family protein n=1 Tax=Leeia oryzae TaxID=356662 RepID=UPI00039B6594|nr:DUF4936 family protein [Leeia oryzae]